MDATFAPDEQCTSQDEAVQHVRQDMLTLNAHVRSALEHVGVATSVHPPHEWANGTGEHFAGDLDAFNADEGVVPITFGDVVPVNGELEFGILSGDDLVLRLSTEVPAYVDWFLLLVEWMDCYVSLQTKPHTMTSSSTGHLRWPSKVPTTATLT